MNDDFAPTVEPTQVTVPVGFENEVATTIREQVAGAVYEHTRKGEACVSLNSLDLGHSHGTRTHTVNVRVGWHDGRRPTESHLGISFNSDQALLEHARKDQSAVQAAIQADLKSWCAAQTGFTTNVPDAARFRKHGHPAHSNTICNELGCILGKVRCRDCQGSLRVQCYAGCDHGQVLCYHCSGSSMVTQTCYSCSGGQVAQTKTIFTNDPTTNTSRTDYVTEYVRCGACQGMGGRQVRCTHCSHGRISCGSCNGVGSVPCRRCNETGKVMCNGCTGSGYTSLQYDPFVQVAANTVIAGTDSDDSPARQLWNDEEFIAAEATPIRARREVDGLMIITHTDLQFDYANGRVQIDDLETNFLAVGSGYAVTDLPSIVAQVMEDDIRDVETAPPGLRDDAIRRLLSSKFGLAAMTRHAQQGHAAAAPASKPDSFESRVARVLDSEARARAVAVHRKALPMAAGIATAAAIVFPLLNQYVWRKIPIELSVLITTALIALSARRRLRREGPLGSEGGGAAVMAGLVRRQRVHRLAMWTYAGIAVGAITLAVFTSRWLADRVVIG